MFAFLVLSTGRGFEIKALAIGIIFDATVIRALLVPALTRLLGDANWWLPGWMARVLRLPPDEPVRPTSLNPPRPPDDRGPRSEQAARRQTGGGRIERRYDYRLSRAHVDGRLARKYAPHAISIIDDS
jgi:hypothetical protein